MRKTPPMEDFQGDVLLYTTYIVRWVLTSFIPLDRICCTIIIGFYVIIFTNKTTIGIRI